jgi:hypothetical protein
MKKSCAKIKNVKIREYPGTPVEINFLGRLRAKRVDIGSVVSFYSFVFHYCPTKIDLVFVAWHMARISDVGHSNIDIGVQATRKMA